MIWVCGSSGGILSSVAMACSPPPPHDIRHPVRKQPPNVPVHSPICLSSSVFLHTPLLCLGLTALCEPSHTRSQTPTRPRFRPMLHAPAHSLGLRAPRSTLPAHTHTTARLEPTPTALPSAGWVRIPLLEITVSQVSLKLVFPLGSPPGSAASSNKPVPNQ